MVVTMKSNVETELKILLTEDQFKTLCASYDLTFVKQVNTYFDTEDDQLKKMKCSMRIRQKENTYLFTCKTPDINGRNEHECYVHGNSAGDLNTPEIHQLLSELGIHGELHQIGELTTYRAVIELPDAELCFDINEYNNTKDYEIEYEYKHPHNGIAQFNEILKPIGAAYTKNCKSKIARACQR